MANYNSTDTCGKIKKVGFSWRICENNFHGKTYKEKTGKENWTGRWIYAECYRKLRTYGTADDEITNKIKYRLRLRLNLSEKDIYNLDTKEEMQTICVVKNPTDSFGNNITPSYEIYRIKDNEFGDINKIWIYGK
jgi:hypothetical protein